MTTGASKTMAQADIPLFVQDAINTGCDICAIGHDGYVVGDSDLSEDEYGIAAPELQRIKERYGDRDLLRQEIAEHLRSIGRYVDLGSPA